MEGCITCGLWLLTFLLGCERLQAFNLDTDNVLRKSGEQGSLFGFSLAMHRQLEPEDKIMLLVGAPRAKALSGQKAKVTGGLFNCDMSSTSTDCSRVNFDNDEDLTRESKENQWMGVTVNSQGPGGKIVTCAHRYQRRTAVNTRTESRDIIGRCYVLSQDLTIDADSGEDGGSWHFCDSRPRGHEMFGSCQQGLSATFDKDYHYFIFGAPGAYNWKGIVRLEQKNNTLLEMGIYDDGPFEAGDENEKNPDLIPAPANSYLGFSLDSGTRLTKKGQLTVVAGAPRANHSGAVVLMKKGDEASNILLGEYTLEGEGLASSFGYDLAVLDLNGDGWEDIVVGAPQYFEKDGEIGGAVYVYVNKAGKWDKVKPTRIDGPQDSMFGLAVENLGDINQDGYHDFAVGAPYEGSGTGNVHIYHGSATGLSSKKASQVLSGQSLGSRLFGYSLAGNMDLDKNSYPDLAVGSLSDSVFVYKARPVMNIKKEIKFTPTQIDLTKKNCGNTFCLTVEACFTYTASSKNYASRLAVAFSLEADADNRKNGLLPRATFTDPSESDNNYESKGTINLDVQGKKKCVKRQLAIQENIRDKLRGIPIDVSVDIQDGTRKRRQSTPSKLSPVLNAYENRTTREEVHFVKEGCGKDNLCQSNLQVKYRYGRRTTDSDTFTPLKLEGGVPVVSLSDQKDIALEVTVNNRGGDDAHEAYVTVLLPSSLTYSAYRVAPNNLAVTCIANKDGSKADCELGNPFKRDSETTFYIILGTAGIALNTTELEIELQLITTSSQSDLPPVKAKAKVAIMLQLSLTGQAQPSQVYFSGHSKDEKSIKTESDIGSAITYKFRIINLGKRLTDFGTATLEIDWPKKMAEDGWLLYLMKINSTGVGQIECTPKNEMNPLKKEPVNTRMRRAVENTQEGKEGTISRLIENKKFKTLTCEDGASCVRIKCPLGGLDSNAVITLYSRLWNNTFTKEYSDLHHVEVIVKASLHVDTTTKNTVLQNAETQVRLTVFPERRAAQYAGVPWWIIVLSILFGLLLLALLAFLLWKCGFFKHAKYEDKVPSYNAVRIRREERVKSPGNGNWENLEKKPWMTTWHDNEHYS
ncbi:integrin alpha-6-like isoform X2 [Cololabis saira]|uniref:integrin alpha-6-like isoform X2 n=1 Tax=Cololabis saira TaxID=129043 RepID=UPI002AD3EB00|nr:integrin alpha-6-like isoform X2 [Cololabis saira]